MKAFDEISKAHDILDGFLDADAPEIVVSLRELVTKISDIQTLATCRDVLCWVMEHDRGRKFSGLLSAIECKLKNLGIEIIKSEGTNETHKPSIQ